MNFIAWIIIGIGIMTGSMFLINFILNSDPSTVLLITIILSIVTGIAIAVGYFTINLIDLPALNMHKAILFPWISASAVFFVIDGLMGHASDFVTSSPIVLVFASLGGVWAYRNKVNKLNVRLIL